MSEPTDKLADNKEVVMDDGELRSFLALLMVSDPWPLDEEARLMLTQLAEAEAQRHGFTDWIAAYHAL